MSDQDDPRPCDQCGRPAERGGELYVYRRPSPIRERVGFYGRECLRKISKSLYRERGVTRVEHRNGRKVRDQW